VAVNDSLMPDKYIIDEKYANITKLKILKISEKDDRSYWCQAVFKLGESKGKVSLKVLTYMTPLKPFLAIAAEVIILVAIIFLYEMYSKKKQKHAEDEKEFEQIEQLRCSVAPFPISNPSNISPKSSGSQLWSTTCAGKAPGRPGRFVYSSRLQANGGCGKGGQHIPRPVPLPAAPIGLEQQTAASGSHDRPDLRTWQLTDQNNAENLTGEYSSLMFLLKGFLVKGNNPDEKNPKPIGLQLQSTASGLHSSIESNGQISLQGQKMIRSVCYFDLKTHPNP
ncbi:Embigin, partial [Chelonia mydas]